MEAGRTLGGGTLRGRSLKGVGVGGTGLAPCAQHLVLKVRGGTGHTRAGAGWGAPELPRGGFTCPAPALPPRSSPRHPPPASQIVFFGRLLAAAGLVGRNINGRRRSRRCPDTSSPGGEEGEGERERGETREPSLGEGGRSPPVPSLWPPPKPWRPRLRTPRDSHTFSAPMRFWHPQGCT